MKEFVDNFFFTIINNSLKGPVSENQKWNAKWRDEITVPPPPSAHCADLYRVL
jgi:hypothetical protein